MSETINFEVIKTSSNRMVVMRQSKGTKRLYIPKDIASDSQFPLNENAEMSIVKVNGKLALLVENPE